MKFQWIREQSEKDPARICWQVLEVSRAGYYAWKRREPSKRTLEDEVLSEAIQEVFAASRETYGSPRMQAALQQQGVACGKHRVTRLMRKTGLISVRRRKYRPKTTNGNHSFPVAENLLQQEFSATAPNERWVGDITYVWTGEGWLSLGVILDLYSREVVGWATSSRITHELVCRAFDMAIFRRGKPKNLLYHSEHGSQYASDEFQRRPPCYGMTPSMSRKSNCYDNAVAESFFDTVKVEFFHRYRFAAREGAKLLLVDFIEEFYNIN
jgi:putative transposase